MTASTSGAASSLNRSGGLLPTCLTGTNCIPTNTTMPAMIPMRSSFLIRGDIDRRYGNGPVPNKCGDGTRLWRGSLAASVRRQRGDARMSTRGFTGRRRPPDLGTRVPPGQSVTDDFPVLSAGPTPTVRPEQWLFTIKVGPRPVARWTWDEFAALPQTTRTCD